MEHPEAGQDVRHSFSVCDWCDEKDNGPPALLSGFSRGLRTVAELDCVGVILLLVVTAPKLKHARS